MSPSSSPFSFPSSRPRPPLPFSLFTLIESALFTSAEQVTTNNHSLITTLRRTFPHLSDMDLSRYASLLQTAKAEHDAGDLKVRKLEKKNLEKKEYYRGILTTLLVLAFAARHGPRTARVRIVSQGTFGHYAHSWQPDRVQGQG